MEWPLVVQDALGRPRELVVTLDDGRVSVAPPPPAGFSLDIDQLDLLVLVLLTARSCL